MPVARLRQFFVLLLAALPFGACMDRPVVPVEPTTTDVVVDRIPTGQIERIDLLFMVDNSLSMADKQDLLAEAVPQLVKRLVDPLCVPRQGSAPAEVSVDNTCRDGFKREFAPLADFHIGVISSSLGSHGGDGCINRPEGDHLVDNDDHARLMPTVRAGLTSYANTGFLAWDPNQKLQPPGTGDLNTLNADFKAHVQAADENGCGYEASLESWYRFLIDPEPPAGIQVDPATSQLMPTGVDEQLLGQRRAFLRPDSLVAVIMLTDENDCSVRDEGAGWAPMRLGDERGEIRMFRGSSDCERDPNSPCCRLCGATESAPPNGCVPLKQDSACMKGDTLEPDADNTNLRCFDQKRRFGFDFLYPIQRYVDGLKSAKIRNRRNELVDNPLYLDLQNGGPATRTPDIVFLAGIVGVPWQDIATPNSLTDPRRLEYLRAQDIPWDRLLGDATGLPKDSLMIETPRPRMGAPPHPLNGAPIASFDAPSPTANPINGHEHNLPSELQYACTFPLDTNFDVDGFQPRPCTADSRTCDCNKPGVDGKKPLCQDPTTGAYSNTQWFAKAYPGVRHLQVLKELGKNAIVASICPKLLDGDRRDPSFGYNPAVDSIADVLGESLKFTCLPRPLDVDEKTGSVPCRVMESVRLKDGQACDCTIAGRQDPDPKILPALWSRMTVLELCGGETGVACDSLCTCEIEAAPSSDDSDGKCNVISSPQEACQCLETTPDDVVGYCYIDPGKGIGEKALVEDCGGGGGRAVRLVGPRSNPTPRNGSTVFVACVGAAVH